MGQATLDLPDPLEPAAAPASPEGADDLLAQLAGDEIDRLLAEAEVEQKGQPGAATAPARSPAADAAFDAALNADAQNPSQTSATASAPQPATLPVVSTLAAPPAPTVPTLNEQMQKVFAGSAPAAPVIVDVPSSGPVKTIDAKVVDAPAPAGPALPVVASPVDAGTSLAERDGLRAGEIEALHADPLGELEDPDPEVRVPLALKPLIWINAPFAAVPEGVREALGKVAIVTLVNAVGVLAYVLIFRKH